MKAQNECYVNGGLQRNTHLGIVKREEEKKKKKKLVGTYIDLYYLALYCMLAPPANVAVAISLVFYTLYSMTRTCVI